MHAPLGTDQLRPTDLPPFRLDLEKRTNELTEPAWQAVGAAATNAVCDAIEPHHQAFVDRIDATAGPRWMPAVRHVDNR